MNPIDPDDARWMRIDAAALALGLSVIRTKQIAKAEHWRDNGIRGRRREYLYADVRATSERRRAAKGKHA